MSLRFQKLSYSLPEVTEGGQFCLKCVAAAPQQFHGQSLALAMVKSLQDLSHLLDC
jgi:hypothetical protein